MKFSEAMDQLGDKAIYRDEWVRNREIKNKYVFILYQPIIKTTFDDGESVYGKEYPIPNDVLLDLLLILHDGDKKGFCNTIYTPSMWDYILNDWEIIDKPDFKNMHGDKPLTNFSMTTERWFKRQDEKIRITLNALDYLDKSFGLPFLKKLSKKYPNIDSDDKQNRAFWNAIAKKKGFSSYEEWQKTEN